MGRFGVEPNARAFMKALAYGFGSVCEWRVPPRSARKTCVVGDVYGRMRSTAPMGGSHGYLRRQLHKVCHVA